MINIDQDSLITPFLRNVKNYPYAQALWTDGKSYNYSELFIRAAQLAKFLETEGSTQCIILTKRNLTAYTAILAALLADKTYVPINSHLPTATNIKTFLQTDSSLMIVDTHGAAQAKCLLQTAKKPFLVLFPEHESLPEWCADSNCHQYKALPPEIHNGFDVDSQIEEYIARPNINPYAYLLFTSGTTGIPKGIRVSHSNALNFINSVIQAHQLSISDRFSQIFELTFDPSVLDMFVCWSVGACLYTITEKYLTNLPAFIRKHELTFFTMVPSLLSFLLNLRKVYPGFLPLLRHTIFGGEILSQQLANNWQEIAPFSTIENYYGPTEATIATCAYRWQSKTKHGSNLVPIGNPFPGQSIVIVDEQFQPISADQIGELCISGSQVTTGYWQNEESSNQSFIRLTTIDGGKRLWYRTGDLAVWEESVGLIYKGRRDDQLQIRGCRVEKLEIEAAIRALAKTDEVAVIAWPCSKEGHVLGLIAYVSNSIFSGSEIKNLCRTKLPDYMIPSEIVILKKLPLTINNKIDYTALLAITEENHVVSC